MATEKQRSEKLDKNIAKGKKELAAIIPRSQRVVKGAVAEYIADPRFTTNAKLRNKLYTELAGEYRKFNSDIDDWTVKNVNASAKDFWNFAKEDLPTGAAAGTFGAFSSKYVDDIIGFINPSSVGGQVAMNAHIGGMLDNEIRALRAAVSTTMAEAAVEGLTNPQMADRMIKKMTAVSGKFAFIDKAGRKWTADNYFGMLNRTLHATSARQSYIDTATREAGFDLYTIEGGVTGSSVSNPGDPCDDWAGRIISMTGATSGYPTYDDALGAGVFHPGCVHFVRVLMPSEIPEAKKEQEKERVIATTLGSE